jgi:branched-chain amino acid transport system permease protein
MELVLQLLISGILLGGLYGLLGVGLTLIFGVLKVINFAHGEFLMLGMYATLGFSSLFHVDPFLSLPFVLISFFLFGIVVNYLIIQRTVNAPHVVQIFATVGLSIVLSNAALILWKADFRYLKTPYSENMLHLGTSVINVPRLLTFVVALLLTFILFYFVKKTYLGKAIRATAQNRAAATLMGINTNRIFMITMGIGAACVGVAGNLLIQVYPVCPSVGFSFVTIAFVVVVLGGLGSLPGALIGGIIVGTIETFSGFYLGTDLNQIAYFVIFVAILIFRPWGLLGVKGEI